MYSAGLQRSGHHVPPSLYKKASEPYFPNWMKGALAVAAAVSIAFAVLAAFHYFSPYAAIAAGAIGGAEILFIPIWYGFKKTREPPPPSLPIFQPDQLERSSSFSTHGTLPTSGKKASSCDENDSRPIGLTSEAAPDNNPRSPENWDARLSLLHPARANLLTGTDSIGRNTKAQFHPVPCIGNYDNDYNGLRAPYIQWRLPASQLFGFPEEMQKIFGSYAEKGLLDLYFIGADDTGGGHSLARNLVMHALALPEYDPSDPQPRLLPKGVGYHAGGLYTFVQMRIFEPEGIDPYPEEENAIPFSSRGKSQPVIYHPGERGGLAISPNNARFIVQKKADYCSFYVGCVYRGKATAFYMILTRRERNALRTALDRSENIKVFSENLEGFQYKDNIDALLIKY